LRKSRHQGNWTHGLKKKRTTGSQRSGSPTSEFGKKEGKKRGRRGANTTKRERVMETRGKADRHGIMRSEGIMQRTGEFVKIPRQEGTSDAAKKVPGPLAPESYQLGLIRKSHRKERRKLTQQKLLVPPAEGTDKDLGWTGNVLLRNRVFRPRG